MMNNDEVKQLWPTEEIERFHPFEIRKSIPRNMRTPITEAWVAITEARWDWIRLFEQVMADNPNYDYGKLTNPGNYFDQKIVVRAWAAPECFWDSYELFKKIILNDSIYNGNFQRRYLLIKPIFTMGGLITSSMLAIKAEESGKHEEAWTHAVDAKEKLGQLRTAHAIFYSETKKEKPSVTLAKQRHVENRALINEVIRYFKEKIDPSLSAQKAATELVKYVPLSHKKIAEIVSAEKKKNSRKEKVRKYLEEKMNKCAAEIESQRRESFSIAADKLNRIIHLWRKKLDEIVSAEKKKQS